MEDKQINRFFTLQNIAEWHSSGLVELPKVQRAFVWKPSQIEDLWDSLLRRYPIGSFVLFPKSDGKFDLLDGQQRATAICLAFGKETFRETEDKVKVFIDLERPSSDDSYRKYFIRVINKSHPWGYERRDNRKTLDAESRRDAISLYEIGDFNEVDLSLFFPYDSSISIPLSIFLEAGNNKLNDIELLNKVREWPLWEKVIKSWFKWLEDNPNYAKNIEAQELLNIQKIEARIKEIYATVKKTLSYYSIPSISLDLIEYYKNPSTTEYSNNANKLEDEEKNDISNSEIENLFIRLNAGGTPLRGEELNYSILKAHISKDLQKDIENACIGFCSPSRLITIAFRLYQHKNSTDLGDGIIMKIKPKQFQRTINDDLIKFQNFLEELLIKPFFNKLTLIEYSSHLLEYNDESNKIGLPHLVKARIAETAPEIAFLILYRIYIKEDRFETTSLLHKNFLGIITLFMWLGKGERKKDHSKLLRNIWPAAINLNGDLFWSTSTVKRAMLNDVLPAIPSFGKSRDPKRLYKIKSYAYRKDSDLFYKYSQETGYDRFIDQMFDNRDLILYAQRDFLSKIFNLRDYYLEDTNQPFDWDHISPRKYTLKRGIPTIFNKWYGSIGNFRAWPFSLNRSDQDVFPAKKFNPISDKWNTNKEKIEFDIDTNRWSDFVAKHPHLIKSISELDEKLLKWSFCKSNWSKIEISDLRKDWQCVFEAIRDRSLDILKEWYENFNIENLIPQKEVAANNLLLGELNQRKWELNPNWLKGHPVDFELKEKYNWVLRSPIEYKGLNIYLFITYSKDEKKIIAENEMYFGFIEKEGLVLTDTFKISEKQNIDYIDGKCYVQGITTLISSQPESKILLLSSIRTWLNNKVFKDARSALVSAFDNSIKIQVRNKINLIN
jgi:hypothetical protein